MTMTLHSPAMLSANDRAWEAPEGGESIVTRACEDIRENGENQELWFQDVLCTAYLAGYQAASATTGGAGMPEYRRWDRGDELYEHHLNCSNSENHDAMVQMWDEAFAAGYAEGLRCLPAWMRPPTGGAR